MNNAQLQQGMKERLERMKTLRDEIRVDLHLAGMELKDRWKELEPAVHEAERRAGELGGMAREALDELVERMRTLRDTVRERKAQNGNRPH